MNQKNLLIGFALALWFAAIVFGYVFLIHYELKPSSKITKVQGWPVNSKIKLNHKQDTLLMFVHPRCPCSRASIAELSKLMLDTQQKMHVIIVFSKPAGQSNSWVEGELWSKVKALPGVDIFIDDANQEARNFMTNTSGEVLLFKPDGTLVYHGGITGSRGHEGDNKGRTAITNYLRSGKIELNSGYAFGCALQ